MWPRALPIMSETLVRCFFGQHALLRAKFSFWSYHLTLAYHKYEYEEGANTGRACPGRSARGSSRASSSTGGSAGSAGGRGRQGEPPQADDENLKQLGETGESLGKVRRMGTTPSGQWKPEAHDDFCEAGYGYEVGKGGWSYYADLLNGTWWLT